MIAVYFILCEVYDLSSAFWINPLHPAVEPKPSSPQILFF